MEEGSARGWASQANISPPRRPLRGPRTVERGRAASVIRARAKSSPGLTWSRGQRIGKGSLPERDEQGAAVSIEGRYCKLACC